MMMFLMMLLFAFVMPRLGHVIKILITISIILQRTTVPLRICMLIVIGSGIKGVPLVTAPPDKLVVPVWIIWIESFLLMLALLALVLILIWLNDWLWLLVIIFFIVLNSIKFLFLTILIHLLLVFHAFIIELIIPIENLFIKFLVLLLLRLG